MTKAFQRCYFVLKCAVSIFKLTNKTSGLWKLFLTLDQCVQFLICYNTKFSNKTDKKVAEHILLHLR